MRKTAMLCSILLIGSFITQPNAANARGRTLVQKLKARRSFNRFARQYRKQDWQTSRVRDMRLATWGLTASGTALIVAGVATGADPEAIGWATGMVIGGLGFGSQIKAERTEMLERRLKQGIVVEKELVRTWIDTGTVKSTETLEAYLNQKLEIVRVPAAIGR